MMNCTDGTWCCSPNNYTDCCNKQLGFELVETLIAALTSPTTNTSSPAPTSAASSTSTPSPSSDSSKVTKVGIGVGVSLGVIVIVGTIAGFWFGQKRDERIGEKRGGTAGGIGMYGREPGNGNGKYEYRPVVGQTTNTDRLHEANAEGGVRSTCNTHSSILIT
jgi:hypothetical protein